MPGDWTKYYRPDPQWEDENEWWKRMKDTPFHPDSELLWMIPEYHRGNMTHPKFRRKHV